MKHSLLKTLAFAAAAGLMALAPSAQAVLITINSGIGPQPANSGDGTIETWIAAGVTAYNAANDPDLPAPGEQVFRVNQDDAAPSGFPEFGDDTLSIEIPTGEYDYIALHWGGQRGGIYQSFYIGTIGGPVPATITFESPNGQNGLSWYAGFLPTPGVPEGGATVALFGLALCGLGAARRLSKKA